MAKYVDGFVLSVPKKNIKAYQKMAQIMVKFAKKNGVLSYIEAVGDDLNPKMGGMKIMKFPQMAKTKSDETVIFSFLVFKSKAHRDSFNAKMMKEMMDDAKAKDMEMPFEMKGMAYGGFKAIIDA